MDERARAVEDRIDRLTKIDQSWKVLSFGEPDTDEWEQAAEYLIGLQMVEREEVTQLADFARDDRSAG